MIETLGGCSNDNYKLNTQRPYNDGNTAKFSFFLIVILGQNVKYWLKLYWKENPLKLTEMQPICERPENRL